MGHRWTKSRTAFKMEAERQRERERRAEWELEDGQGAGGGTGRKERDGGDIEPNALNKASVMELMTGCVPLVTRSRTRATSPTTDARLVLRSPSRFPREFVTTNRWTRVAFPPYPPDADNTRERFNRGSSTTRWRTIVVTSLHFFSFRLRDRIINPFP